MKIFIPLAFAFAIALGLIFVPPTMLSDVYAVDQPGKHIPRQPVIIPDSYIVTLKPEFIGEPAAGDQGLSNNTLKKQEQRILIKANEVDEQLEDQGGSVTRIYDRALNGFAIEGVQDVTPFVLDPAVDSVEPTSLDFQERQVLPTQIDRIDLDRAVTASSKPDNRESRPDIDVAVIDGRVVAGHPDLNLVNTISFIGANPAISSHGTHVAGLCCAKDNLGGVVGGIPGARVTSLVVCPSASCDGDAVLDSWDYLISHASTFEIATMSIGGGSIVSSAMETAGQNVIDAGITFFTSAGNDHTETVNDHYCGVNAFICVSALADMDGKCGGLSSVTVTGSAGASHDDRRAAFSNWGSDVDIMAPGVLVLSTYPYSTDYTGSGISYIGDSPHGTYAAISGTSMATPVAAGIGGLIASKNPSWTPAQIKTDMQAKAYSQTQSCDGQGKGGLVSGANSDSSEKILYAQPY